MATQEKKHIETYEDMAGYRFERYAKWLSRSKDCDDDLLKALGGGSGLENCSRKCLLSFERSLAHQTGVRISLTSYEISTSH
jgi:hypothetical protein